MAKKYPASVYSGIHRDDENSWGMCCSYEAACQCAEEHYDINLKDFIKSSIKMGIAMIIIIAAIVSLMRLEHKYEQEAIKNSIAVCSYCHQHIAPEHNYLEFNNEFYHIDCFNKSLQNLEIIPRGE